MQRDQRGPQQHAPPRYLPRDTAHSTGRLIDGVGDRRAHPGQRGGVARAADGAADVVLVGLDDLEHDDHDEAGDNEEDEEADAPGGGGGQGGS